MRRLSLGAALTALLLAGCASGIPPEQVQAWVGRPATDLVREWGPPTKEVTEGDQRVLIYEEMERTGSAEFSREVSPRYQDTAPVGGSAAAGASSTIGYSSYARSYLFWVDAAGKITRSQIHKP
ncbi:MAG TPA: hypothetical protein VIE44_10090 [Methylomirabilota bacterium]|jgi:hypothetical protein